MLAARPRSPGTSTCPQPPRREAKGHDNARAKRSARDQHAQARGPRIGGANVTMDPHGVERVDFNALGGTNTVSVYDLSGTDPAS